MIVQKCSTMNWCESMFNLLVNQTSKVCLFGKFDQPSFGTVFITPQNNPMNDVMTTSIDHIEILREVV